MNTRKFELYEQFEKALITILKPYSINPRKTFFPELILTVAGIDKTLVPELTFFTCHVKSGNKNQTVISMAISEDEQQQVITYFKETLPYFNIEAGAYSIHDDSITLRTILLDTQALCDNINFVNSVLSPNNPFLKKHEQSHEGVRATHKKWLEPYGIDSYKTSAIENTICNLAIKFANETSSNSNWILKPTNSLMRANKINTSKTDICLNLPLTYADLIVRYFNSLEPHAAEFKQTQEQDPWSRDKFSVVVVSNQILLHHQFQEDVVNAIQKNAQEDLDNYRLCSEAIGYSTATCVNDLKNIFPGLIIEYPSYLSPLIENINALIAVLSKENLQLGLYDVAGDNEAVIQLINRCKNQMNTQVSVTDLRFFNNSEILLPEKSTILNIFMKILKIANRNYFTTDTELRAVPVPCHRMVNRY